ncbi:unnamed protein product [Lepeophtheirus salmonis]|uniref:(salmon louse) hypothetical protein n=1 Tax=Lepeophtheirus salmonis TaxID=72036 RepID=A0A7R8CGT0_LEPSM|nr:unnamed protein product [Lepeophtheirus salmonis]CAF2812750.1 unnamed protein product [Lepeophtheirus salmonis]
MTSEESPLADSTTPRKVPGKASEKKKSAKIIKAPKPPPKTTQRGEIVRKAAEDRFLQEKGVFKSSTRGEKSQIRGLYGEEKVKREKRLSPAWIKTALNKGYIKQAKGVGISGSFKLAKRPTSSSISINTNGQGRPSLDCLMPHIFTWVCEPKEASAGMIKKYLNKFYKDLTFDGKSFKKALEHGVLKGQLERLTGKGACGTFSLVDGANKTGARFEDAIEDAIIAMNEPKDASVSALKHYLSEFHTEDIWREEYESDSEDNKAESPKKKKTSKTSTLKSSSKKEWLSNGLKNKKKLGSSTPTTSNSSKKKSVNKKKLSKSPRKNGMAPLPPKKAMTKRVSKKSST